jgi:hypothetical protein
MVDQFGDQYREYMARTGRFGPRSLEQLVARVPLPGPPALRPVAGFVLLAAAAVGGAFALRSYTIASLPLWSQGRVTAMTILPDDAMMLDHRMANVLEMPEVKSSLAQSSGPILVYLIPPQYVMQGMIADTGPQWRLYEHHQTLPMIADWIFHPFRHLQGGHMMMHHDMAGMSAPNAPPGGVVRRLIFLKVDTTGAVNTPAAMFAINATRAPQFFADVDIHNLVLLGIHALGPGTGWGRVPTPMF